MKAVKVIKVNGWREQYLKVQAFLSGSNKLIGFTTFWHTIWIVEDHLYDQKLLAHELTHIKQIDDLGIIKFTWKYLMEQFKNGYRNNKFEVEARAAKYDEITKLYSVQY